MTAVFMSAINVVTSIEIIGKPKSKALCANAAKSKTPTDTRNIQEWNDALESMTNVTSIDKTPFVDDIHRTYAIYLGS